VELEFNTQFFCGVDSAYMTTIITNLHKELNENYNHNIYSSNEKD